VDTITADEVPLVLSMSMEGDDGDKYIKEK
jgi:hypothetical protein